VEHFEEHSQSATEQLLERSWEMRERRASERELIVDITAGILFLIAAAALLAWGGAAGLRPGILALLIAVYALVGRIEFPVGAGYVVPTMLIVAPTRATTTRARWRPAASSTVLPARPPLTALNTTSGSSPALVASTSASPIAAILHATMIWFASLVTLPAPTAPVSVTDDPMDARIGCTFANAGIVRQSPVIGHGIMLLVCASPTLERRHAAELQK